MVAALQLANGDTEKATELMLSGELYDDSQKDDQAQAMSAMILQALTDTAPRIIALRDAVKINVFFVVNLRFVCMCCCCCCFLYIKKLIILNCLHVCV